MTDSSNQGVTQKKGIVSKCPSCGAQLGAFVSACESCGHELAEIDANRTITALATRLDDIEREVDERGLTGRRREEAVLERRSRVIRDFPIPNAREDLQQLLYFIQPKLVESLKPDANIEDWRAKFAEVLSRAKYAYKNDSGALAEFDQIEKSLNKSLSATVAIRAKRNPLFVVLLVGVVALGAYALIRSQIEHAKTEKCEDSYAQSARAERGRLEGILNTIATSLQAKDFAGARAALANVHWDVEATCKIDDNQKATALWASKKSQADEQITKAESSDQADKQLAAEKELAANQAEAKKAADLARIEADKERARVFAQKRTLTEKSW